MKYEYTPFLDPRGLNFPLKRKPLIEVELFGNKKSIKIPDALIDSGADYCLFNIAFGKEIVGEWP